MDDRDRTGRTWGIGGGPSGSLTLVFDGKGQAALVLSAGGGGYAGAGGGVAATLQATDADRVQDLNGPFVQTGGSLQLALFNGGAEWVVQAAPDGAARRSVNGLNINLGAGVDLKKIVCPLEFHSMWETSVVHVLPTATMFDEGVDPNLFWRY